MDARVCEWMHVCVYVCVITYMRRQNVNSYLIPFRTDGQSSSVSTAAEAPARALLWGCVMLVVVLYHNV